MYIFHQQNQNLSSHGDLVEKTSPPKQNRNSFAAASTDQNEYYQVWMETLSPRALPSALCATAADRAPPPRAMRRAMGFDSDAQSSDQPYEPILAENKSR